MAEDNESVKLKVLKFCLTVNGCPGNFLPMVDGFFYLIASARSANF
jgi:hypothetical protein